MRIALLLTVPSYYPRIGLCKTFIHAVAGGWSTWVGWGACSVSCGGGTRSNSRSCTDPAPQYGGSDCHGSSLRVAGCNSEPCPSKSILQRLGSNVRSTLSATAKAMFSKGFCPFLWRQGMNHLSVLQLENILVLVPAPPLPDPVTVIRMTGQT